MNEKQRVPLLTTIVLFTFAIIPPVFIDNADFSNSEKVKKGITRGYPTNLLIFFAGCAFKIIFPNVLAIPDDDGNNSKTKTLFDMRTKTMIGSVVGTSIILIHYITLFWIRTHFKTMVLIYLTAQLSAMFIFVWLVMGCYDQPYIVYGKPPVFSIVLAVLAPILSTTATYYYIEVPDAYHPCFLIYNSFLSIYIFDFYVMYTGHCKDVLVSTYVKMSPMDFRCEENIRREFSKPQHKQVHNSKSHEKAQLLEKDFDNNSNSVIPSGPLIVFHKDGPITFTLKPNGSRHEIHIV